MSLNGDKKQDKKDAKKQYRQRHAGTADYAQVDTDILVRAITTVANAGGALRFGYSGDGGIFALGVLGDGGPYTLWCRDAAELAETLQGLTEHFDDLPALREGGGRGQKRG